ncbi:MAG: NAD(P)/FAD-dependent oxidoreductase [Defluviitaleaceae bacterium]|nr:NAD(P)/FAD-dependent oxidoreductase [Defluviitaleaceae bacterium]
MNIPLSTTIEKNQPNLSTKKIIIIGAGPAGMMAAGRAAQALQSTGATVAILEQNDRMGKKLYITGKGRCNLTNNTDIQSLVKNVVTNPRFLQSAFHALPAQATMEFFENRNTPIKTERGGRVFPASDYSGHIIDALVINLKRMGVVIKRGCTVNHIEHDSKFLIHTSMGTFQADALIIATGGLSYPSTGSTGDGYGFASSLGHNITSTHPSLVPLITEETWVKGLEGLSLKNISCKITATDSQKKRPIYIETGEMLFTANGVTGPAILRASAYAAGKLPALLEIDLKPGLTHEQLNARILRDFTANQNKTFANAMEGLLPKRMIDVIVAISQIPADKKVNAITKQERQTLTNLLKALPLTLKQTAGYKEAVITKGGVNVKEINPSTLMSKIIPGLFFAGEIIDVDALTGGYNLQIAFSTGHLAGQSAANYIGGGSND